MSITLRFNNVNAYVYSDGTPEDNLEIAKISHALSYTPKGQFYMKDKRQQFATRSFLFQHEKFTMLPTGLIHFLFNEKHKRHLKNSDGTEAKEFEYYSINADVVDERKPVPSNNIPLDLWNEKENKPLELFEHQKQAIEMFLTQKRGVVRLPTGSGKTGLGIALTQILGLNTLFVVNNLSLQKQTIKEFKSKAGIGAGMIGDQVWNPQEITVATIQTLSRHIDQKDMKDFLLSVQFVIFDEIQHASNTYQKVSRALKNAYWRLGLSATALMGGKENKMKSMSITGPLIYDLKLEKLVKTKHLAKPTAIFLEIPLQSEDMELQYAESWDELYSKGIVYNEVRNYILAHALIAMKNKGCSSLALVERIEHGHNIVDIMEEHRKGWKVEYISGEHSTDRREEAKASLQASLLDVLVTSRIFNEGVDIPLLASVVNCAGYKAAGLTYQKAGRGLRRVEFKEHTIYIDCYDKFNLKLQGHAEERLKVCRKSKAFEIEIVRWEDLEEVLKCVFEKRNK